MENLKLYDPKVDTIFKMILKEENNKNIALSFLNSIVYGEGIH